MTMVHLQTELAPANNQLAAYVSFAPIRPLLLPIPLRRARAALAVFRLPTPSINGRLERTALSKYP